MSVAVGAELDVKEGLCKAARFGHTDVLIILMNFESDYLTPENIFEAWCIASDAGWSETAEELFDGPKRKETLVSACKTVSNFKFVRTYIWDTIVEFLVIVAD